MYPQPQKKSSSRPTIAGILLILAALFGVVTAVAFIYISSVYDEGGILEPDAVIEGEVVYAANDTAVANVLVKIEDSEEQNYTDSEGRFRFDELATGKYTIFVNKTGYKSVYKDVYITEPDEKLKITIELEEGEGEIRDEETDISSLWTKNLFLTCGVLILVFSLFAFIGGIFAFKRNNYWLALLGSVFGMFALGAGIGFVFSLIALFMLLLSRNEFDQNE